MKTFGTWLTWDDARAALTGRLPATDLDLLAAAYAFAAERHAGQTRPAGEPYTRHLLEAAEILATELAVTDAELLAAALLHDVVEDTPTTSAEVAQRFGPRVAALVDGVTKPPPGPGEDPAAVRRRYLIGLRDLPADGLRLKLADRYSNVQRLHTHPRPEKQRSYYAETCRDLVPLAAVDPRLAALFADWERAYAYLADTPA
ncbi:bifunctional (p)ppGpp synthetase/guanosine-3',5'-bis(diphosphate) 3'-pyrophosphohydrolase [Jiangella aurantiaca]|uniref:Bifunctional (P)ppGpp synthetase/guanosine-3',5'-bis(Diphosphate) 3'-pyrophosphohydrolase n=1 Tax=Jiangella aurantiaca TaxID=2530373 RepID=A0A4R5ACR9_9ACTN|nr:HD domain-containing protein [Jiangella aurantiaca]TDD68614.1 bifunctional (p)ppGpp synthetase/guanosine-3',5'-bis(diphosphate) 3'-pyrophosphohydrolase [Jiangella aurantiaca]